MAQLKVIWFGSMTDCEFDLTSAIALNPDIHLTLYAITDPQDKNNEYHKSMLTHADNIIINEIEVTQVNEVCKAVAEQEIDLVIIRHPVWIANDGAAKEICDILSPKQKVIVWTWEWVPNYAMAQMPPLKPWPCIAVTNTEDYKRAKLSYPTKQIIYLPFGTVKRDLPSIPTSLDYSTQLLCDAQPHYECKEYNGAKRLSVNQMIKPALDLPYSLGLWGSRYGETTLCDWGSTEEFRPYHKGSFPTSEYPKVYRSCLLYLGVTWNYGTGGFSIRLARALSCGIGTLWQETEGRINDFPENIIAWSINYDDTQKKIVHYMDHIGELLDLGMAGYEYANQALEWGIQIKRLKGELE